MSISYSEVVLIMVIRILFIVPQQDQMKVSEFPATGHTGAKDNNQTDPPHLSSCFVWYTGCVWVDVITARFNSPLRRSIRSAVNLIKHLNNNIK